MFSFECGKYTLIFLFHEASTFLQITQMNSSTLVLSEGKYKYTQRRARYRKQRQRVPGHKSASQLTLLML